MSSVSSSLRRGFLISAEGDCASAKFDDSGNLAWHSGRFNSGATRRCTLTVLTRRNAAGTLANVITDIRVIPSGFLRVEAAAELRSERDPERGPRRTCADDARRDGRDGAAGRVSPRHSDRSSSARGAKVEAPLAESATRTPTEIVVGAWAATVIAIGFLLFFVALAHEDWRAYADYRETRCTVFGSEVQSFESRSRSRNQEQSYKPLFAVHYPVDGVETFSAGYATSSALSFNTRADTGSVFDRFAIGTTHLCWYDPQIRGRCCSCAVRAAVISSPCCRCRCCRCEKSGCPC